MLHNLWQHTLYFDLVANFFSFVVVVLVGLVCFCPESQAQTNDQGAITSKSAPVTLRQSLAITQRQPMSLNQAVKFAADNYPTIIKGRAQVNAAKYNVTVQKMNEYLPDGLMQYQEVFASHNKLSQIFYGSPVFPAISGPGFPNVSMKPTFFSGGGFNIDWAPIDFGLHKARITMAKDLHQQASKQFAVTKLDVEAQAASAFLDVVVADEQVKAATENVKSFEKFSEVVRSEVDSSLKPGADSSLADAQLAGARNDFIRAKLSYDVAVAALANAIGLGGESVSIDPVGLVVVDEPADVQRETPLFKEVPIVQAADAAVTTSIAQRKVLDKEYWPVFHFLGGVQMRGAGLNNAGRSTSASVDGVFPTIPNYQVAFIANWNFFDVFRLHQEKKVQDQRILQARQDYDLVLKNLRTEDLQSRARVKASIDIASNTPLMVKAASDASRQAVARYQTGLGSIAQVAEANQALAQSRMQDAAAKIGVWRSLLDVATVHGDLTPFLVEANHVQHPAR